MQIKIGKHKRSLTEATRKRLMADVPVGVYFLED
jgi:asparagine synthetase B (glutamine-hydrolysing)